MTAEFHDQTVNDKYVVFWLLVQGGNCSIFYAVCQISFYFQQDISQTAYGIQCTSISCVKSSMTSLYLASRVEISDHGESLSDSLPPKRRMFCSFSGSCGWNAIILSASGTLFISDSTSIYQNQLMSFRPLRLDHTRRKKRKADKILTHLKTYFV